MTKTSRKPSSKAAHTTTNEGKMGKSALVEAVSTQTGLTRAQTNEAVDTIINTVIEALQNGQSVSLPNLGIFSVKATAARTGVKPGTTEKIQIPAGKKVSFKVSTTLKQSI